MEENKMVAIINSSSCVDAGMALGNLIDMEMRLSSVTSTEKEKRMDKFMYNLAGCISATFLIGGLVVLPITYYIRENSMTDKKVAYAQQLYKEPKEYKTKRIFGEILKKEEYSLADIKRTKFLGLKGIGREMLGIYGLEIIEVKDDNKIYRIINTKTPLQNTKGNKINIEYKIFPGGRISLQEFAMEAYKMPPERAINLENRVIKVDGWY